MLATGLKLYLIGSSASIEASNSLLSKKLKFKRIELVERDMIMLMRIAVAIAALFFMLSMVACAQSYRDLFRDLPMQNGDASVLLKIAKFICKQVSSGQWSVPGYCK